MIDRDAFYTRRAICLTCDSWKGVCLRGHALQSAQGCPIRKFEPLNGADYAEDKKVSSDPIVIPCCGQKSEMPPITWAEVLRQFAVAMLKWGAQGFPLASAQQHGERYGTCKACPHFVSFYCRLCRCIGYLKTKVATEQCPDQPPRWKAISASVQDESR